MRRTLAESSRWLGLASLLYGPLAYGCTESWAANLLDCLLLVIALLWIGAFVLGRRVPVVSVGPVICVLLLVGQSTFMLCNPHFRYNPESHSFLPVNGAWEILPGVVDRATAGSAAPHIWIMLLTFLFFCEMAQRRQWRRRVVLVMGAAGGAFVVLGLLQRATSAPAIFWGDSAASSPFFGTFFYHGNAGSFINLVLPVIGALCAEAIWQRRSGGLAVWLPCLLLCLAASVVNASRAAALISALLITAQVIFEMQFGPRRRRSESTKSESVLLCIAICAAVIVGFCAGAGRNLEKWELLRHQLNAGNPRLLACRACIKMVRESGFWGFGPGSFRIAFPHYTTGLGDSISGVWKYAHQDYLQTIIEWGMVGAIGFGIILFGGLWRAFSRRGNAPEEIRIRFAFGLAIAGVLLHGMVDFPLQIPSLQLYVAACAGVAWSKHHGVRSHECSFT